MAATLPELEPERAAHRSADLPDASVLEDRVPDQFKAPRVLAGYATVVGLLYLFFNYRGLWHTDLWGHLSYGRHLWQNGMLPPTEPLMPLAKGVPFVDTAWLSQLLGFAAVTFGGVTALQFLYGFTITLCTVLLLWRFHARAANPWIALAGIGLFLWVNWQQFLIVRPQLAGLVVFVTLFVLLTARRWSPFNWVAVPVLFAAWANLHGSFPVGLGLLGFLCAGRAVDLVRRTGALAPVFHDQRVSRLFFLLELAAAAVLANPYGLQLYGEVFSFAGQSNLADLIEWQPLHLRLKQGQAFAAAAVALIVLYRVSPRRVSAAEALLLVGFGAAALWTSRMILWWAPIAAYYFVLHASAVLRRRRRHRPTPAPSPRAGKWSVVTIGLIWIAFAYTPFGLMLIHGNPPELERCVSQDTPVRLTEYLRKYPPEGQVFNTLEWGDYLLWAGPPDIQVFVASHVHLLPHAVWKHYLAVVNGVADWEDTLDRFGVNTVVVDQRHREFLIRRLKRDGDWRLTYEDNVGAVFVRRNPIP